jgi:hypothetical protein
VGDEVTYERYEADTVSAIEMFRNFFEPDMTEAALRRYLAASPTTNWQKAWQCTVT